MLRPPPDCEPGSHSPREREYRGAPCPASTSASVAFRKYLYRSVTVAAQFRSRARQQAVKRTQRHDTSAGCAPSMARLRQPRNQSSRGVMSIVPFCVRSIIGPFLPDLGRHAVEALGTALGSGESHVGNGARDASVPVVEGVNRDEPEMSNARLQHGVHLVAAFKPGEEGSHLSFYAIRSGRFVVNALPSDRAGDDLHGSGAVVPPVAAGREQGCAPGKQSFLPKPAVILACGVERHIDRAFHVPVCGRQGANSDAEPPGDGEADLSGISFSPSISLLLSASEVSACSAASCRRLNPRSYIWPVSRP